MRSKKSPYNKAFALPSVLIASVVLLSVLVTAVSVTITIRSTLREQHYVELAKLAGEAGTAYAKNCLEQNNGIVTWSDAQPLRPNTDCTGTVDGSLPEYVIENDNFRTYFVVNAPVAGAISGQGYIEALRSSTGIAWRVWGATASAQATSSDSLPVGTSLTGYWTTPPPGYLLEDNSCVSQSTYADLYAVIGSIFGTSGCNAGEFRLPDSRGKVAVNEGSENQFDTLGETGGATSHTHELSEDGWARIGFNTSNEWFGLDYVSVSPNWGANIKLPSGVSGASTGTSYAMGTILDGETDSDSSLQPYIVVTRVIKY